MMNEAIAVALITGGLAFLGTVITVLATARKTEEQMKVSQAVTETKLEQLTSEVRAHNDFARRIPVLEERVNNINNRVDDIEEAMKK